MAGIEHRGSCHCGAIGFVYRTGLAPERWSIRACQCRFCRAHDALSASAPDATIEFVVQDAERLQRYRFGLGTADFLLCRNCGVYVGALITTGRGEFGIINVHALDPEPSGLAAPNPISYDGEDTAGRVQRREERWSPASVTMPA